MARLFLHLEGELKGRQAKAVARHIADCWVCRAECERLSQNIFRFIECCETVSLPPPPASRHNFYRRLREGQAEEQESSGFKAWLAAWAAPAWRSLLVGGMSLATTIVVFLVWAVSQNSAAAQFLERARGSSGRIEAAKTNSWILQKVRIQRGSRVIERAVYHGAGTSAGRMTDLSDPAMERALSSAHIRRDDPLNIDDFAAWRSAQFAKWDTVDAGFGRTELRTRTWGASEIREASLTVSQVDWHPVSRKVEFWDGPPLEVTEIALEIRELPSETFTTKAPPVARTAKSVAPGDAVVFQAPFGPTRNDLEDSEILLRERFHSIGADVREAPEIWRSGDRVLFRVIAQEPARGAEILRAAASIPLVFEAVHDAQNFATAEAIAGPSVPVTAPYSTNPPLAKSLRDHLGGLDPANRYLDSVRDIYFHLLAQSVALERLGKRYPPQILASLTPKDQASVARIANDHIAKIQEFTKEYFELLRPVWDAIAPSGTTATSILSADCSAWQQTSELIPEDLRRLHLAFFRLFVQDQVERPLELSAEGLLAESARAEQLLKTHLAGLCPAAP